MWAGDEAHLTGVQNVWQGDGTHLTGARNRGLLMKRLSLVLKFGALNFGQVMNRISSLLQVVADSMCRKFWAGDDLIFVQFFEIVKTANHTA